MEGKILEVKTMKGKIMEVKTMKVKTMKVKTMKVKTQSLVVHISPMWWRDDLIKPTF